MSNSASQTFSTQMSEIEDSSNHFDAEDAIDVELMLRAKERDHNAFQQLVERHQNAVIGTVARMLGNPSDAADISQQVFLRLWKSAPRYQQKAKFTTFLFTITRNLVFNETRRRSKHPHHSIEERETDSHFQIPDSPNYSPDNAILEDELRRAVDQAIEKLPEQQRLAVILRRYENLPYEEIAEITGLTLSAVKSQLFRARTTLREELAKYLDH